MESIDYSLNLLKVRPVPGTSVLRDTKAWRESDAKPRAGDFHPGKSTLPDA